jgi:hypothetical protein
MAALDDGSAYASTSSSATTVTLPALANATPNASHNAYDGAWVYIATGPAGQVGQQRRVQAGGYDPSTGTLTITPNWTTAPSGGVIVEISRLFPATSPPSAVIPTVAGVGGEDPSYRTLLNRTLSLCAKPAEILLPIGTARTYDLSGYWWFDRQERLLGIWEPDPIDGLPQRSDWRGWAVRWNADATLLTTRAPFSAASGSITLEVLRPCVAWIRNDTVWAQSENGLVDDDDTSNEAMMVAADVDPEDIMPVFLMCAYEALSARSPGRPYPGAADMAATWRERAQHLRFWDHTQSVPSAPSTEEAA